MQTLSVDPQSPAPAVLALAVDLLRSGGVVAFPTETFYGLGADPRSEEGLEALWNVKGRPAGAPILLLLGGMEQARTAARDLPPCFDALARDFWPGPLTLVVPARDDLSARVTAGTGTVGLRVPGLALPRALARSLGGPITGTSANRSGSPPARTAEETRECLGSEIALVLDGGPAAGGAPSTVVDLCGGEVRLIRQGVLPFERIQASLSRL